MSLLMKYVGALHADGIIFNFNIVRWLTFGRCTRIPVLHLFSWNNTHDQSAEKG